MVTALRSTEAFIAPPAAPPQRPAIAGAIGLFDLTDWWLTTFTPAERARIESLYRPANAAGPRPLTQGDGLPPAQTAADLLASLATWLYRPQDRPLARRVLAKAGERAVRDGRILELHYTYQVMIQTYYRDRHDPAAHTVAVEACEKMIALAPRAADAFRQAYPSEPLPRHYGFHLLTMIRERQGRTADALRLAIEAHAQGWAGDWPRRVAAYQKIQSATETHGSTQKQL